MVIGIGGHKQYLRALPFDSELRGERPNDSLHRVLRLSHFMRSFGVHQPFGTGRQNDRFLRIE